MSDLKSAKKVDLVDILFKIRSDWTEEDMIEAGYNNSGEMIDLYFH